MEHKQALMDQLRRLKDQRRAVILAHNYQRPEVQDAADFVGDSLGLSRQAAASDARVVLFCGVHFMAETASILCPDKTVLMPAASAGCPLANTLDARELAEEVPKLDDPTVITYVNSTAEVKAASHMCCTSANAVQVLRAADPDRPVFFGPDRNLGTYAAREAGRRGVSIWQGSCPTHDRIRASDIEEARRDHPGALVVVHPECTLDVIDRADHVASTSGMLAFCGASDAKEFIIGTEVGMLHPLRKANPDKTFHAATPMADCPDMKLATLPRMLRALEEMSGEIQVPEAIRTRALGAITKMVEILP